jgi:sister-chromatid-cohesion protein PDS5
VADILRIFAPEAPYKTAEQIKIIFYFLIKQLGGLRDPKDPAFKRFTKILGGFFSKLSVGSFP